MIKHKSLSGAELRSLIRKSKIKWSGNIPAGIYGNLNCSSGKRMKRKNRVFFESEEEAELAGFRPCGHCMFETYWKWKKL